MSLASFLFPSIYTESLEANSLGAGLKGIHVGPNGSEAFIVNDFNTDFNHDSANQTG